MRPPEIRLSQASQRRRSAVCIRVVTHNRGNHSCERQIAHVVALSDEKLPDNWIGAGRVAGGTERLGDEEVVFVVARLLAKPRHQFRGNLPARVRVTMRRELPRSSQRDSSWTRDLLDRGRRATRGHEAPDRIDSTKSAQRADMSFNGEEGSGQPLAVKLRDLQLAFVPA